MKERANHCFHAGLTCRSTANRRAWADSRPAMRDSTQSCCSLISQSYSGAQLVATDLGARLGNEDVAAKASLIVRDLNRDLLARQTECVESPPQTPPTHVAVGIDGR